MSDTAETKAAAPRGEPFPWHALDKVTRGEADASRAFRSLVASRLRVDALSRAAAELLGDRVSLVEKRVKHAQERGADDGVGVVFAASESERVSHGVLVEVEGALASAMLRRALKRPEQRVIETGKPASADVCGAVAAVLVSIFRRAVSENGAPIRVISAGPGFAIARDYVRARANAYTATFSVMLGADAFEASVTLPIDADLAASRAPFGIEDLADLGVVPLSLSIVASADVAHKEDVAKLARGDAWIPSAWKLASHEGKMFGPVVLAAPRGEIGIAAELGKDGKLVLGGERCDLRWDAPATENEMGNEMENETSRTTALTLEDAPVVVRVEIGVAEMRASDWARVARGDVIALGHRIAEPVVLRVSGVEVARGELVQVDGEVGVRVLERI